MALIFGPASFGNKAPLWVSLYQDINFVGNALPNQRGKNCFIFSGLMEILRSSLLTELLPVFHSSHGDNPLTTSLPRVLRMKMALYGVFTGIFFISRFYYGFGYAEIR
jgi:hypothetical protein